MEQQAATLEPQACWTGTATVRRIVSWNCTGLAWYNVDGLTDGDAQAVEANEVLTGVAAGELLAVAALGLAGLGVDLDLGVLVRGTALGEGNSGHGGDDERLVEGHFVGLGWVGWKGLEASVVLELDCWMMERSCC